MRIYYFLLLFLPTVCSADIVTISNDAFDCNTPMSIRARGNVDYDTDLEVRWVPITNEVRDLLFNGCKTETSPAECSDGIDNDSDGLIDSADSGCNVSVPPVLNGDYQITITQGKEMWLPFEKFYNGNAECGGNISNLPSGIAWDTVCNMYGAPDTEGTFLTTIKLDDASHWQVEFTVISSSTLPPTTTPDECSDGLDNDGDGLTDSDDPGCIDGTELPDNSTSTNPTNPPQSGDISFSSLGGNGSIVLVNDGVKPQITTASTPNYGIPNNYTCNHQGNGQLYHVGPGQAYENLGDVPWLSLTAGDTVMIEWRQEPYREKIGIEALGTSAQPVRICGVRGPNNQLPVLDGNNATTSEQFQGFFSYWQSDGQSLNDESLAVIYIKRGKAQPWGYKPRHIEIANLKVVGAHPNNTYTNAKGVLASYYNGAAGIRGNIVENLTITSTEITGNGNGFFVLSKGEEEEVSRNILFERNYVHDNGVIGDYHEHNIYTQADGEIFQYNVIENPTPGMLGSTLKSRGVNTIIRYNWIESGARLLDLVDPEDSSAVIGRDENTYVYGNILINDFSRMPASTNMIHFGGDSGDTAFYRQNLHFFNNSVVTISAELSNTWRVTYFDLPTSEQTVYIANNIFDRHGDSYVYLMRASNGGTGNAVLAGNNWFNAETSVSENSSYNQYNSVVTLNGTVMMGAGTCFSDVYQYDFSLKSQSSCIDAAVTGASPQNHPLSSQYKAHFNVESRAIDDNTNLGALD